MNKLTAREKQHLRQNKRERQHEQKRLQSWLQQYLPKIDLDKLLKFHHRRSNAVAKSLINYVMTAHANVDGVIRLNEYLKNQTDGENLLEVDVEEVIKMQEILLKAYIWRDFLQRTSLSFRTQKILYRSYLKKLFSATKPAMAVASRAPKLLPNNAGTVAKASPTEGLSETMVKSLLGPLK